jgi:succinoglycan biosynthesis transport protein ExoP
MHEEVPPSTRDRKAPESSSSERVGFSLKNLMTVIKSRYPVMVACILVGTGLGILAAFSPRVYQTTGRMQVSPGSADMYKIDKASLLGDNENAKLESEVDVLQSDTLLLQVAAELNLANDPDFMFKKSDKRLILSDPATSDLVMRQFSKNLSVQLLPRSEVIAISCTTRSAALSARIINTLINDYIERIFKARFASTQRVAGWLSNQLGDLKQEVESEQEQLVELQKKLGVVGIDKDHNIVTSSLENLTRASSEAKVERIIAEARYRALSGSNPDLIEGGAGLLVSPNAPSSSQFSLLSTLRAQQAQLATQFAETRAQFGPNYPESKRIKAELDTENRAVAAEQTRVLEQSKNAFEAAKTNENMTSSALQAQEADAFRMRDDVVRYDILQHVYESNRQLYQGLLQRLREASIVSGLASSEVDVIDLARIHSRPAGLNPAVKIALGLLLGILLGLGAVILVEALNTKVRDIGELEQFSGLTPLAILPAFDATGTKQREHVSSETSRVLPEFVRAPKSLYSESILGLRSSLLLTSVDKTPQVILLTSAIAAEGKSTTSVNLASSLSQLDAPTLIIECDLRRPTLGTKFGVSNKIGITSVLTGKTTLDEAVLHFEELPNLSVLLAGPLPPAPADILASRRMEDLIRYAKERYTYIVLDCPSALMVADPIILSHLADAVIFVFRIGKVDRFAVRRITELFRRAQAPLFGFVVNGVTRGSMAYGYDTYMYTPYESTPENPGT